MAISPARTARQPSFGAHPLRRPAIGLVGADPHLREREQGADGREASRRQPAWLTDLSAEIDRSVIAIERVVARVGTMRKDNSHLREVTAKLHDSLVAERSESGRRLAEQGASMSREKRRTADAERSADALAGMLCDLERQLSDLRMRDGQAAADVPVDVRRAAPARRYG